MVENVTNNTGKTLKKLNLAMTGLSIFIIVYCIFLFATKFREERLNNDINLTSTNTVIQISSNYLPQIEYKSGDIVFIKYFNIHGVIENKLLFPDNYYYILYIDSEKQINRIELPTAFLLKPNNTTITPYSFY